ncbi:MAG: SPOR domain-containing protein [Candidatus Aminicenantes bacterium]|nr:SPOR domain-containing protein [Candidatus Aminicenantes bacterium]
MPKKILTFMGLSTFVLSLCLFGGNFFQNEKKTVIELENEAVRKIEQEGIRQRFTVEQFGPRKNVAPSRITLSQTNLDSISVDTEYLEDNIAQKGQLGPDIWGRGSIHRFMGRVELKVENADKKTERFVFISEGEKDNRLTFWVGNDAYVYLRGKGRVVMPSGTQIVLPRDYDEKEIKDYFGTVKEEPVIPSEKKEEKKPAAKPEVKLRTMQGYRVQIAALNREEDAEKMAGDVRSILLDVKVYVDYIPPYWKIRVGNCRTQREAAALKEQLVSAGYTTAWVVRSEIEVK